MAIARVIFGMRPPNGERWEMKTREGSGFIVNTEEDGNLFYQRDDFRIQDSSRDRVLTFPKQTQKPINKPLSALTLEHPNPISTAALAEWDDEKM